MLQEYLSHYESRYRDNIARFEKYREDAMVPNNDFFRNLDATCLYGMVATYQPKLYVEIGSGYSTMIARRAANAHHRDMELISIDPDPRLDIDAYCDGTLRRALVSADANWIVDRMEPDDILFTDGSHRATDNSDVAILWAEIIPYLKPGVLVHLHDVFLPAPYPERWEGRDYSEQYLLATALAFAPESFYLLLANGYISETDKLVPGARDDGKSFWFTRTRRSVRA